MISLSGIPDSVAIAVATVALRALSCPSIFKVIFIESLFFY